MPKPIPIHIEVEEMFVGRVMRLLNGTDGVVKINLDFGGTAHKPNGAGAPRGPYKTRKAAVQLEETGQDAVAKALLGKPPMTTHQLRDVFVSQGRSPSSINSVLHTMKNNGELQVTEDGYSLTKKMRDRLYHRKAAKKK